METYQVVLALIAGVAILIGLYYLLKILLAYIGYALIGGAVLGGISLFACIYIVPNYAKEVGIVGAIIGAVLGLVCAIFQTTDITKSRLAKDIAKDITQTDPNGTKYTARDQYGNTKTVEKTGNSILGDSHYKDSEGNSYERSYGSNELK